MQAEPLTFTEQLDVPIFPIEYLTPEDLDALEQRGVYLADQRMQGAEDAEELRRLRQ